MEKSTQKKKIKTCVVSCRLPEQTKFDLINIANNLGLKINDVIEIMIAEGLKRFENESKNNDI